MNVVAGFDNPSQPRNRFICRFYQRGICRFGNRCRNIHSNAEASEVHNKRKVPEQQTTRGVTQQSGASSVACSSDLSSATYTRQSMASPRSGPSTSTSTVANEVENKTQSDKTCGICLDTISEKKNRREQTYGILPNCNHCFCFTCIRKWRQSKEFDFDVSKACPECRKPSDYVYASTFWYEIKEEKEEFITKEKSRMQRINCRYYKKGDGNCPFGNTCLYLHALPNGKKIDVGPPKPRRRRASNTNESEMLYEILYWLNQGDLDLDDDDDVDSNFELELDESQYDDRDNIRRYIAHQRQFFSDIDSDVESEDFNFSFFI